MLDNYANALGIRLFQNSFYGGALRDFHGENGVGGENALRRLD